MGAFFAAVGAPFRWLPFCCKTGAVAGALTGFLFALMQLEHPALVLTPQQRVVIALLLAVAALLLVLFLFGVLLRYGVLQIFWGALLNTLITALLTVWIDYWLGLPAISAIIGALVGVLVGFLLCRFCDLLFPRSVTEAPHGKT